MVAGFDVECDFERFVDFTFEVGDDFFDNLADKFGFEIARKPRGIELFGCIVFSLFDR